MKSTAVAILGILLVCYTACRKKENPQKTLNKSYVVNKIWQNRGGSITHDFGEYQRYGSSGQWMWLRDNSDTMMVVFEDSIKASFFLKFYWCTEHEMSCEVIRSNTRPTNTGAILFKDHSW